MFRSKNEGNYQNTFSGNFKEFAIFTFQSSPSVPTGDKMHVKHNAPAGYEILTATVFWKDNIQVTEYIGFDYERSNTDITVVYTTGNSSRSYFLTLFCRKI